MFPLVVRFGINGPFLLRPVEQIEHAIRVGKIMDLNENKGFTRNNKEKIQTILINQVIIVFIRIPP